VWCALLALALAPLLLVVVVLLVL
jgi:hypothetical protein